MTVAMWFICAALTMPAAMYAIFNIFEDKVYRNGKYRFNLDGVDWTLGVLFGAFFSAMAWPLVYPIIGIQWYMKREERRELKRKLIKRRNDDAYNKLKEARRCLLQQKRDENTDACLAWSREWNAALKPAHDRLIAQKATAREVEARTRRRIEQAVEDDWFRATQVVQGELMYDDRYTGRQEFGPVCRHGISQYSRCSLCYRS